jgi:hypothetical protein
MDKIIVEYVFLYAIIYGALLGTPEISSPSLKV